MQYKGSVHWILRDKNSGNIIDQGEENNIITNRGIIPAAGFSPYLYVSSSLVDPDYFTYYIDDASVTNQAIPGLTAKEVFPNETPPYVIWRIRFDPPTEDRTIRCMGNCSSSTTSSLRNIAYYTYTALKLTTPILQTPTTILDVFYRIQFSDTGGFFNEIFSKYWLLLKDGVSIPAGTIYRSPTELTSNWHPYAKTIFDSDPRYKMFLNDFQPGTVSNFVNDNLNRKSLYNFSSGLTQGVGSIITHMMYSHDGEEFEGTNPIKATNVGDSIVQNIYGHDASAINPFYNPSYLPQGQGLINFDDSSWTDPNDFAKMFRVNITNTGAIGVSTYQYMTRPICRLGDNPEEFKNLPCIIPFLIGKNNIRSGSLNKYNYLTDLGEAHYPCILPYNNDGQTILLATDTNLLWRINIITGSVERWGNNGQFPSDNNLPVGTLSQISVDDSGNIWVADRDNGLYRISADGLTVDFFDATSFGGVPVLSNNCYGVDIGNGKIWAAFEGGLAYTTDNGTSWTTIDQTTSPSFIQATINGNWSTIKYIKADKNSVNDDVAVMANVTGNSIHLFWWNLTNPTPVQLTDVIDDNASTTSYYVRTIGGSTPEQLRGSFEVQVSSQSDWAFSRPATGGLYFMSFGNTTANLVPNTNTTDTQYNRHANWSFIIDKDGNDAVLTHNNLDVPKFIYPNNTITDTLLENQNVDSDNDALYGRYIGNGTFVYPDTFSFYFGYLIDGSYSGRILKVRHTGLYSAPGGLGGIIGESLLWKKYGWNGSAWVLNDPGSKTTHSGLESIEDGLLISFDNNGDQFVDTDYYTTIAVDGVVKDGSTDYSISTEVYIGVDAEEVTTFEPSTVQQTTNIGPIYHPSPNNYLGSNWVDLIGLTTNSSTGVYKSGITPLQPGFPTDIDGRARSENDLVGDFNLYIYPVHGTNNVNDRAEMIFGLIDPSNVGNAHVDDTHITHGIYYDWSTTTPQIHVRENGVNVYTWPHPLDDLNDVLIDGTARRYDFFNIRRTGTEIKYFYRGVLMYTSLVALSGPQRYEVMVTGPIGTYFDSDSNDNTNDKLGWGISFDNYFCRIGNSTTNTGYFNPLFDKIDQSSNTYEILIDGIPASTVLLNDHNTVLNAGEVSLFPKEGILRFSPSDAGKTVTGSFTAILINQ